MVFWVFAMSGCVAVVRGRRTEVLSPSVFPNRLGGPNCWLLGDYPWDPIRFDFRSVGLVFGSFEN